MQLAKRLMITSLLVPWAPYCFTLQDVQRAGILSDGDPHSFSQQHNRLDHRTLSHHVDSGISTSPSVSVIEHETRNKGEKLLPLLLLASQTGHHWMLRRANSSVANGLASRFSSTSLNAMMLNSSNWRAESPLAREKFKKSTPTTEQKDETQYHRRIEKKWGIDWNKKYFGAKLKNWVYAGVCLAVTVATCCNFFALCCICCFRQDDRPPINLLAWRTKSNIDLGDGDGASTLPSVSDSTLDVEAPKFLADTGESSSGAS
jgi:hypothetical protein